MRPIELTPLFASLQSLTGIGPRLILLMRKCVNLPAGITEPRVLDLLWHLPNGVVDRRAEPAIAEAVPGTIATLKVRVLKHYPPPRGNNRAPYKVRVEDETGKLDLVFFHAERKFIERQLPVGEERYVSGRIERYGEKLQMSHPDYIVPPEARGDLPMLEPVYPLTAGLSGKIVQKATRQALERLARGRRVAGRDVGGMRAAGRTSARRCSGCTSRPMPATSRPAACRGSGSPTTSCWPGSWRSRWCGRTSRRAPAGS